MPYSRRSSSFTRHFDTRRLLQNGECIYSISSALERGRRLTNGRRIILPSLPRPNPRPFLSSSRFDAICTNDRTVTVTVYCICRIPPHRLYRAYPLPGMHRCDRGREHGPPLRPRRKEKSKTAALCRMSFPLHQIAVDECGRIRWKCQGVYAYIKCSRKLTIKNTVFKWPIKRIFREEIRGIEWFSYEGISRSDKF